MSTQVLLLAIIVIAVVQNGNAAAQEFRIESHVYDSSSTLPISQNVTLFSEGIIYDFQLTDDAQAKATEIAIYDTRNRNMILLDPAREIRFELADFRLLKIVEAVRRDTAQDPRTSFLVNDTFTDDIDMSTHWVTLTSPQIEYRFHGTMPEDASVMPLYFQFLDNYTWLNASDPTKIPPFARMQLNQAIRKTGWLPSEVQISVKQNGLFRKPFKARSTHVMIQKLSDQDVARIAQAKQHWMLYKNVELAEYRNLPKNSRMEALGFKKNDSANANGGILNQTQTRSR